VNTPYPMLWFDDDAEEAARFYTSLLPNSEITDIEHYGDGIPGREPGSVMAVGFTLNGARFSALNGGPHDTFNDSISLVVGCADQAEIDRLWDAFTTDGGREVQCGWLVDKFGVSWQIIPENIGELLSSPGAVAAMLQMTKLDIAALEAAAG
jgi:predicted 3-demethylubiquinone-9 3-methyltransferase (glyoxalase superfamily)